MHAHPESRHTDGRCFARRGAAATVVVSYQLDDEHEEDGGGDGGSGGDNDRGNVLNSDDLDAALRAFDEELEKYLQHDQATAESYNSSFGADPLRVWRNLGTTYPVLQFTARIVLLVFAHEISCERLFSVAK